MQYKYSSSIIYIALLIFESMEEDNQLILEKFKSELSYRKEKIISEAELNEVFTKAILKILRTNHQKIFNILYKHDISEEKAAIVFKLMNDEDIAQGLATLFIEREKQKIQLRKKYSSKS